MRRSDEPTEALQLWLEAEVRRSGARALSVSTPHGIPVAQFGPVDPRRLAAAAGLASRGARVAAHEECPDVDGCALDLGEGLEIVVGACGSFVPSDAEAHVRRILR